MIIGVTGTISSGKDSVSEFLVQKGFALAGTGDIIREYIHASGLPSNRDTQREMGDELSGKYGSGFLLKEAIKRAKGPNKVISGIRQPNEADYFVNNDDTYLIAVDAPIDIRFRRMQDRKREGDPTSIAELKEKEAKEMTSKSSDKSVQNISYCMGVAQFHLDNSGTKEELYEKTEKILEEIYAKNKKTS